MVPQGGQGRNRYLTGRWRFAMLFAEPFMPRVNFTPNLRRHLACTTQSVAGMTVRAALDQVFVDNPALRAYVLDDQNRLRKHVTIFIDGAILRDRESLSDSVTADAEIYVMQALSGG